MRAILDTAGVRLAVDCEPGWVADLLGEGAAGELRAGGAEGADVIVRVERNRRSFSTRGLTLLARGAWHDGGGAVVLSNACTAGFDLLARCTPDRAELVYRWRPPTRDRVAARALRSRFHLLARAALMQFPALWWAGTAGRAPLHASGCIAGPSTPLVTAPSGVGRSTLLLDELAAGGFATGDNLAVSDGATVWGVVEPVRVDGAGGRRMPHGRAEAPLERRVDGLAPDSVVVLRRGAAGEARLESCRPSEAARALVTSTYMAGELRRYWAFAATLSAGTGLGPAHPPVAEVAEALTQAVPCHVLTLAGGGERARLSQLLAAREVPAWA